MGKLSPSAYQFVVYVNVVLYSICWMAQVPVMPYLVQKLGAEGSTSYGRLQSFFQAVQFVGGLLSGPLMDHYGGRLLLALSFGASAVCYALTATASSLTALYLSRLPTVLQHAVLAARALVTQLSEEKDRARVLGYIAVSYGVGFAVGPAVGGLMSSVSLQFGAWVAFGGSLLSLALVLGLLPDVPPPAKAAGEGSDGEGKSGKGRVGLRTMLGQFVEVFRRPGMLDLLGGKLAVGLAGALFQSLFPLMLQRGYGLGSRENGMVLSFLGVLFVIGQATLVGPIISRMGEARAEVLCCAGLALSYAAMAFATALWQLVALLVPLALAGMLYNNANTSRLTKAALPSQRGTVLALDMSLFSGVRMFSPALGTWAMDLYGPSAPAGCAAALVSLYLLALVTGVMRVPGAGLGPGGSRLGAAGSGGAEEGGQEGEGEGEGGHGGKGGAGEGGPGRKDGGVGVEVVAGRGGDADAGREGLHARVGAGVAAAGRRAEGGDAEGPGGRL